MVEVALARVAPALQILLRLLAASGRAAVDTPTCSIMAVYFSKRSPVSPFLAIPFCSEKTCNELANKIKGEPLESEVKQSREAVQNRATDLVGDIVCDPLAEDRGGEVGIELFRVEVVVVRVPEVGRGLRSEKIRHFRAKHGEAKHGAILIKSVRQGQR